MLGDRKCETVSELLAELQRWSDHFKESEQDRIMGPGARAVVAAIDAATIDIGATCHLAGWRITIPHIRITNGQNGFYTRVPG